MVCRLNRVGKKKKSLSYAPTHAPSHPRAPINAPTNHQQQARSKAAAATAAAATADATTPPRGACTPSPAAFWIFAVLGWLDFMVVAVLVTPGSHWLRQDGHKVDWFEVGGGSDVVTDSCDAGTLSDDWCNKCESIIIKGFVLAGWVGTTVQDTY